MPEAGESELLFFDTFSHENTEELNLDLVQFPRPVLIHEVRVVPLGTRVQADVPGGTRLGATNPSSFKLDLFVNNLTKPNAATFEKLGVLDYKGNDNIQLPLEVAVPTDGLIIKGWYSTITLAVYGCPTTVTKDRSSPPPPPPPRSKAQGDCLMVIPPAVIDNVQQNQALPQQVNNAANKTPQEWDPPVIKPGSGTPISGTNQVDQPHSYQQPSPNSAVAGPVVVAPTAPTAVVPAPQKTPNVEIFHDIDERFSGVQPGLQAPTQKEKNPGDKKAPQVEFDEHGEAKFPKGEFESDELFEAYLREKDRKREEEKRERAERERERAERYRKESRSRTPDKVKGHSRDHTRSTSRSRSRSTDREYRRSSRDREYRDGGTRDYREHRDSDREYRERDRYSDRGRADSRDRRDSRERDRRDSRERDRRDSRERDKEGKDRHDSRDRDHSKSQGSQDKPSSRDRPRDRDRRDSGDRGRERTPERNKSPKSRTPRRSRSRTPPLRRSRSRSRERDRNYDRERGREYREKDRDREKDYDKGRDREKERENFRERDKDYDREYRVDRGRDRDSRYDREKDKERERDGWSRTDRRDIEGERPWDKNNRDVRDIREQATVPEGEWDRSREQHPLRDPALLDQPPPVHPQHALREPIPVRDSHNQRNQQWHPDDIVPPQPSWNREVPPSAVDNTVQVWPHNDRVQQDSWARGGGRLDEMQGTWAPPPQVVQQQPPPQFPIIPEEPIPTNTVIVPLPQEDIYEGMPTDIHGEEDEIYTPLSDGEIEEEPAYSDISSDENFLESLNDEEYQARLAELQSSMDGIEDPWNYAISSFNPYQVDLMPLETFTDPSLTVYELEKLKLIGQEPSIEMPEDARKIQTVIDKFKETVHHEEWVESMEGLIPRFTTGLSYLISKADAQDVINSLVETTFEGLDLNKAMQQPLTVYKVRHLKMGVRMAGGLCACDTYVSLKLITAGVQHKLIDLFESKYIFATMKLNIIRALDSTVNLRDGMDWFLGKHPLQLLEDKSKDNDVDIPYKRYLKMMMTKEMSRVMVAMTALLRKIHVYELLNKFTAVVEVIQDKYEQWLAENTSFPDSKAPAAPVSNDTEVDMEADVEPEMPLIPDNMTADDIENLISCLQEVTKVILNTDNILGQPPKILPSRSVFSIVKPPAESTQTMFHLFTSTQLLEGVFVLLSSPATFNHNGVFNAIKDLLVCMISTQSGLLYMCSKHETVNGIIRALTQTLGYTEEDDEGGGPRGPHPAHLLGLQLIYYLQTLQNIDRLREYHAKGQNEKDLDDAEPLGLLHCLYMMTFTPQGRDAVVHVFTMADNLGALLPFIELPGDDALDVKVKRSVCHSYTVLLLLLIVRHSENVQYLEKYSQQLLTFAQHEPASNKTFDKVTELQDWLSPLKKVSVFQYETAIIAELVKLVKHYSDEVTDLPKGLVTTLRIIKHLCLHPENPVPGYEDKEGPVEMKFKYAVIEVYSSEAMPLFQLILQKLGEMLTRPFQQILPKMGMPRMVIMYTVTPVLSLVKAILQHLIGVRQSTFADLTMLNCLFQVHTVMCSVSHSGTLSPEAQCIQNTVVDILMTYTQPSLTAEQHTEEALAKSLWTMMCKELLKYVITAPYTFLSGLILTSELLPLPLPIQTKEPMTAQEVQVAINQRKLWSAHLHPLSNHIQDILQNLSGSACQPLQQLLRRVCWQLADLAGPSALMVVRCLLETVTESMDASIEINMTDAIRALPPEERPLVEYKSSAETAKILNLLAFLMNQPPVKTAFIYLSSGKSKLSGDEKHTKVLLRLARLLNVINEKSPHIQAQESIVSIFQSLCDLEVTMIPAENNMAFVDQLANSLPPRDQMAIVCEAMLLHIDQRDHNFSSILPALRTLALLMLHDFGFYHVKIALEKVPRAFYNLFQQINNTFSKDSSDCIATLSSAIELLQFLVALPEAPEGEEQTVPFERTYLISYKDLRDVLQWNKDPAAGHPLSDLDTLLHEYAKEEETLKAVYESVNLVVSILKSDEDQPKPDMFEPMLPEPEALPAQFEMRSIYLITDDEDDRLSATYWLATPMGEDSDDKEETVRVDFEEIAHKYCQDFDLVAEIEKGAVQSDPPIIKRRRSRIGRRLDTINTSKMRGKNGRFVAPMRGRGYGRVMPINKNDMFRSRPQNTSRPPSMHVDDFIKMELQGGDHPQIGPTGMNPHLTKFREQFDSGRGRGGSFHGRGRGRGNNSRGGGRFFSPPSNNYQRRDNTSPNMGGWGTAYNGGHSGSPTSRGGGYRGRGSATGGINTRGSPPKPPQSSWGNRPPRQDFNQSGFHYRGSTAGEWGQRNDRGGGRGFSRGWGGGGGAWRGKDERRFMPPPGTPPFYGRRDNRHQRSFTK